MKPSGNQRRVIRLTPNLIRFDSKEFRFDSLAMMSWQGDKRKKGGGVVAHLKFSTVEILSQNLVRKLWFKKAKFLPKNLHLGKISKQRLHFQHPQYRVLKISTFREFYQTFAVSNRKLTLSAPPTVLTHDAAVH